MAIGKFKHSKNKIDNMKLNTKKHNLDKLME